MLDVSNSFEEAIKGSSRKFETRIKMGNTTYTKNDISNWVYTSGSISGETFQIGSAFSNAIKIEFPFIIENVKELDEIIVEIGVMTFEADTALSPSSKVGNAKVGFAPVLSQLGLRADEDVYEFVPIGAFYVTSWDPDRNENKTVIEASDSFVFLEDEYVSKLSYPASIRNVALEIANLSGSVVNETNFSAISTAVIAKPVGYTYRQAIGLIAQFEAGYARFNRKNQLEVRQLVDPNYKVTPSEYFLKGLTKNELMFQVGGISCTVPGQEGENTETVTYTAGSNTGPQIVLENKVMTSSLIASIWQKIRLLNFYPFSLNWRGNPAVETGDWLTLTDRDGTTFKAPNLNCSFTFTGGLTAKSSADTNSSAQTVSAYRPPLNQVIKDFNDRLDAAGGNHVYEGIEEPPYPKEGDIWFKPNGPDTELWVYSKLEDGSYGWVEKTSTKLSDEIKEQIDNMVPSDEIIKDINLSKELGEGQEWLRISGAKIWLTDQTLIDEAVIKDAMIDSLNASKVNVGTLNAANVNIINLNASNISTGTLRSISIIGSSFETSGINNMLKISDGTIDIYSSGLLSGTIDSSGQSFYYGTRKIGHIGEAQKTGNASVRGIVMNLETTGDFISWGVGIPNSTSYNTMLALDPGGTFTSDDTNAGIRASLDILVSSICAVKTAHLATSGYSVEGRLDIKTMTISGENHGFIGSQDAQYGIAVRNGAMYFINQNVSYSATTILRTALNLSGLGIIYIPKAISSSGAVTSYVQLNIS